MKPLPDPFGDRLSVRLVEWAANSFRTTIQDMGIDHGGLHVSMPEQFLHGPHIVAGFQQLRGERVPQGMAGDVFGDPGQASRGTYRFLQTTFIQVMAALDARAGIHRAALAGNTYCQPHSRLALGYLRSSAYAQIDRAVALHEICGMELFHPHQVLL